MLILVQLGFVSGLEAPGSPRPCTLIPAWLVSCGSRATLVPPVPREEQMFLDTPLLLKPSLWSEWPGWGCTHRSSSLQRGRSCCRPWICCMRRSLLAASK